MNEQFDSSGIRKELFILFMDTELDISEEDFDDLMEDVLPIIEDAYAKGYEMGRVVTEQTIRELEVDVERDIEKDFDLATLEDLELFSTEPE